MDRDVNVAGNKRSLNFCREQSFAACTQIDDSGFVSVRRDDSGLDCYVGPRASNRFLDQPGLCPR